jgi:hypothetical protein
VVLDAPPLSRWPSPLVNGVNYLSLDAATSPEAPVAEDARYMEIPDKIESWLASGDRLAEIRQRNGEYFDEFLEPTRLGAYIGNQIGALASQTELERG